MQLSLQPSHVGRYLSIAALVLRHGGPELVRSDDPTGTGGNIDGTRLAADLEKMGPAWVKLGQLLSTRGDLLPAEVVSSLERLQDDVEPIDFSTIEEVVTRELDLPLGAVFDEFDPEPIASASLAQVHRAVLGNGHVVAVKVRRPGIEDDVRNDLAVVAELAGFLEEHSDTGRRFGFRQLADQYGRTMSAELDFRAEAANLRRLGLILDDFEHLVVPQPVRRITTEKVLVMDHVAGRKISEIGPLGRLDLDGKTLASELFQAYLEQVLIHGFLHADPHPGNVLVTDDGRLALIDLGMVSHLDPRTRERLAKLLIAAAEGSTTEVCDQAERLGTPLEEFDRDRMQREVDELIGRHRTASLDELEMGGLAVELSRLSAEAGLRPAPELSIVGKALLNLDQVATLLDPTFDPERAVRDHAASVVSRRMWDSQETGGMYRTALETKEFMEELPARANRLVDSLSRGEFRVKVDAIDQQELLKGMDKIATRVSVALVIAALVVGGALTMGIDSTWSIGGYAAVPLLVFVLAALGGLALVGRSFLGDKRDRRSRRR